MSYITTYKPAKGASISLDQMLGSTVDISICRKPRPYPGTVTRRCETPPYAQGDVRRLIELLKRLPYIHTPRNLHKEYKIYTIPKRSGGERKICAPSETLYRDQVTLRTLFEKEFFASYHTTAFAYCKGRNSKRCLQRHQANKSRWFLKLDFEDFFGNTSKEFVMQQLASIAPFSEVIKYEDGKQALSDAIDICFLNNGLPQGTPISPMLTNLIMIPFDHEINRILHAKGFVYTRYADDIQISHKDKFIPGEIVNLIKLQLRSMNMPYRLKTAKTRFGSSSGKNWNLGLMLNNENKITIGHVNHKLMKARLHSFAMDFMHHKPWNMSDVQKLAGQWAYFKSVEPITADYIMIQLSNKLRIDIAALIKLSLSGRPMLTPDEMLFGSLEDRLQVCRMINQKAERMLQEAIELYKRSHNESD